MQKTVERSEIPKIPIYRETSGVDSQLTKIKLLSPAKAGRNPNETLVESGSVAKSRRDFSRLREWIVN